MGAMSDLLNVSRVRAGINAGARLDRLPIGPFHRRILLLIGLGMFLDACDIYLAGGVLGSLVASGWSTLAANALFMSATFLGMLVGTLSAGYLGDRYGRRFSYQLNLLIFGLASIAASFSPTMQVLIGARFIMGIGMGAEIIVGYASLAEFMPRARRGFYVAMLSVITNCAVPFVGLGGAWLIPTLGWRALFAIIGACALVVWFMRKNMPESPRWLESKGRLAEAEAQMALIEADAARSGPLPPVREVFDVPASKGSYRELFSRDLIGSTVLAVMIAVVSGVSLYGFLGWLPTFLVKQGLDIRSSLLFVAIMGFGAPLGGLLGSLVADRFGRRRTLVVASVVQAALGVAYPAVTNNVQMVLCGFALSLCAYAVVAVGFALYIPEMFPTRSRLRGASVASGIGRLTSSGVGFVIVSVFGTFGITGVSGFLVACNLVLVACILLLGRETSQRALEEIETNPDTTALAAARTVAGD
jgi:putative MFS transporter